MPTLTLGCWNYPDRVVDPLRRHPEALGEEAREVNGGAVQFKRV
jgi:hypothetical protein